MSDKKISKKQIQIIHIAKAKLKLCNDDYRLMLRSNWDVSSSKNMTYRQAYELIQHMKKCGFRMQHNKPRRKSSPGVTRIPSSQILAYIAHLKEDVNWKYHDGYYRWIKKSFGIEKIKTMAEAIRIVEGLKKMLARQESKL